MNKIHIVPPERRRVTQFVHRPDGEIVILATNPGPMAHKGYVLVERASDGEQYTVMSKALDPIRTMVIDNGCEGQ